MPLPFLTAHWKNLVVVNYEVAQEVLMPLLPRGVELDFFEGKALMSIVAFRFCDMRIGGVIPAFLARNFEEINLRFYVKRRVGEEWRRGVVFVREVVPSRIVAFAARTLYNEPYSRLPMSHDFSDFDDIKGGTLAYSLVHRANPIAVRATTKGELGSLATGSVESFILEHYWGYTRRTDGTTSEYRVAHPSWRFWPVERVFISPELAGLYSVEFEPALASAPHSVCVAQGSDVSVFGYRAF